MTTLEYIITGYFLVGAFLSGSFQESKDDYTFWGKVIGVILVVVLWGPFLIAAKFMDLAEFLERKLQVTFLFRWYILRQRKRYLGTTKILYYMNLHVKKPGGSGIGKAIYSFCIEKVNELNGYNFGLYSELEMKMASRANLQDEKYVDIKLRLQGLVKNYRNQKHENRNPN